MSREKCKQISNNDMPSNFALNSEQQLQRRLKCCEEHMGMMLCPQLKSFKKGREEVEDEHRSGRPSMSKSDENVSKVHSVLAKNKRSTIRMIADKVKMSKNFVHRILTDVLCMKKTIPKMAVMPRNLADEQKENRLSICQEMLD